MGQSGIRLNSRVKCRRWDNLPPEANVSHPVSRTHECGVNFVVTASLSPTCSCSPAPHCPVLALFHGMVLAQLYSTHLLLLFHQAKVVAGT